MNVPLDQINALFPNCLDMVYNFNSQFLDMLVTDVVDKKDTGTIGFIFDKHVRLTLKRIICDSFYLCY